MVVATTTSYESETPRTLEPRRGGDQLLVTGQLPYAGPTPNPTARKPRRLEPGRCDDRHLGIRKPRRLEPGHRDDQVLAVVRASNDLLARTVDDR